MLETAINNNQAELIGEIISNPEFNHEIFGTKFYATTVATARPSGVYDLVPILIEEDFLPIHIGDNVHIAGQFRSFNKDGKLILNLLVREIEKVSGNDNAEYKNDITLDGYICKKPIYRTTPMGKKITEVILAVNRAWDKTDYIPCICWGSCAKWVGKMEIGTHVQFTGRIQSREYVKNKGTVAEEKRTAYEISVWRILEK